jgi:DNA-3-methyladenine glycosylase
MTHPTEASSDSRVGDPIEPGFFARSPAAVAPELLGAILLSTVDGIAVGGRIVETEAYLGSEDPGSHAATRGMTKRNSVMYGAPGSVYVYFTYGNHHMLNLVCEPRGTAGAVLIRAIEPLFGLDQMRLRRNGRPLRELCDGPGKLTAALGINLSDNGTMLGGGRLTLFDGSPPGGEHLVTSGRIGLSVGHELQLRWYDGDSEFVSRGKPGPSGRARTRPTNKGVSG